VGACFQDKREAANHDDFALLSLCTCSAVLRASGPLQSAGGSLECTGTGDWAISCCMTAEMLERRGLLSAPHRPNLVYSYLRDIPRRNQSKLQEVF
jgi:hypothetical protein